MYYDKYPIGHPRKKMIRPEVFNEKWFGLIKCKIVAPWGLYIPVLPTKLNCGKGRYQKLIFPLCKTCAEMNNQNGKCTHNDEERAILDTWSTEEVKLALSKGYCILRIYEVWDFYHSTLLFKNYIKKFMQLKLQSSEFGGSKKEYIAEIKRKMGIELDESRIQKNPVIRCISKLCMNSLYGKFAYTHKYSVHMVIMIVFFS